MVSFTFANSNFALQLNHWTEVHSAFLANLKRRYKRCISAFVTLLVATASIALIAYACGLPVPFLRPLLTAAVPAQTAPTKPKLVRAVAAPKCTALQTQSDTLFTSCPSFSVDYSNMQKGSINKHDFNVYTGVPIANHEAEYYTGSSANLRVANGSLVLEALNQSKDGYHFTSSHIDTHGKEDFLYGKMIVRAKLPSGIGTWPAIWLLPSQPKYASQSPATDTSRYLNDGEIDIVEAVGTQPNVVYSVAHSLAYPEDGVNRAYFNTTEVPDDYTIYHNYELDWTPTSLTFSVDGQMYFTYIKKAGADWHSWPYDQPFYLVVNLAIGGSWGGTDTKDFPGDGVDTSALPATLNVQSINYYSYIGK